MAFADTIADLAEGAGLLLALSYVVSLAGERLPDRWWIRNIATGTIFGVTAVVGMTIPLEFSPGVFFDARSVVIGVGSAFGGPVVAAISGVLAALYRLSLGGAGAPVGVAVIATSATIGLGYWWIRRRRPALSAPAMFLAFGLVLHLVVLAWFTAIPGMDYRQVFEVVGVEMLLVFTPATALMCLLMRDIGTRAAQRAALEARDADYRRVIDGMIDIFYRTDSDCCVTMVSPSATELLGYAPDEITGRELTAFFVDPEDQERFITALEAGGGRLAGYEAPLRAKDGREVWVSTSGRYRYDEKGRFAGVEGTARDITERRRREEESRIMAERLSLAAAAADVGVWDHDLDRREKIVWDSRMYEIYGVESDGSPLSAATWRARIHPDDIDRLEQEVADTVAGRGDLRTRFRIVRPDGEFRHIEGRALLHRAASGTPPRLIGVNRDVTAEVEAERRLLHALKMEAVGQLTGGLAHDFNNILAVVLGNLEAMEDVTDSEEELTALRNSALKATLRGAELTQRLLAFSRRQTLMSVSTDVNELVAELTELLRRALGERIAIECRPAADLHRVMIDPGQLENALLNMAINARDAMPGGGRLAIETVNVCRVPDAAADSGLSAPCVMISMSDTGDGMPAEIADRIFDPFFTTKEVGKGSGLGLSMVYGFVQQSGGYVAVDSTPGEGTEFRLYLPRAKQAVSAPPPRPADAVLRGSGEHILLVEDNPDVRCGLHATLERLGYSVFDAKDGPAALMMLDGLPPLDLLITDVAMPRGMDGPQIAECVRERHGGVKTLFTSGSPDDGLVDAARSGGGVAFLSKPCRRDVLARTVRRLLDGA